MALAVTPSVVDQRGGTALVIEETFLGPNHQIVVGKLVTGGGDEVWIRSDSGVYTKIHENTDSTISNPNAIVGFANGDIVNCSQDYVARREGGSWTDESFHPNFTGGMGLSSASRVLANGDTWGFSTTQWWRWNGTAWVNGSLATDSIGQVGQAASVSSSEAWYVNGSGGKGRVWRTTDSGANWTNMLPQLISDCAGFTQPLGVYAVSATEVYLVGNSAKLVKWNGSVFSVVCATLRSPTRIVGTGSSNIIIAGWGYAGGTHGYIDRWNGSTLSHLWDSVTAYSNIRHMAITPDGKTIALSLETNVISGKNGLESSNSGANWAAPGASWPGLVWGVGAVSIAAPVFSPGVAYEVHMGPLGNSSDPLCYGGPGNGYRCYRSEDGTLAAVTPPVANGSLGAQQVSISGFVSAPITVIEAPFRGTVLNSRRCHPPWAGAGARRVELEERRWLR